MHLLWVSPEAGPDLPVPAGGRSQAPSGSQLLTFPCGPATPLISIGHSGIIAEMFPTRKEAQ